MIKQKKKNIFIGSMIFLAILILGFIYFEFTNKVASNSDTNKVASNSDTNKVASNSDTSKVASNSDTSKVASNSDTNNLLNVKTEYLKKLDILNKTSAKLDQEYNTATGQTQNGMNIISLKQANLYNNELNNIYQYLKKNLNSQEFNNLQSNEILWINEKDFKINKIREANDGGSITPFLVNQEVASLSKNRCIYLINKYMK